MIPPSCLYMDRAKALEAAVSSGYTQGQEYPADAQASTTAQI
ncbi:MAG: hypothetical protein AAFW75_16620 [Cyanobacteria bacterium J06636_16]